MGPTFGRNIPGRSPAGVTLSQGIKNGIGVSLTISLDISPQTLLAKLDRRPASYWWLSAAWLILLCGLAFGLGLGNLGLMDKTEALFVEVAHQMVLTGDWITPRWNGELFFDYPVGGYWMVALSFKIFGFHEWAARLPSALAAIAVVVATFFLIRFGGLNFGEDKVTVHQAWFRSWLGTGIMALNPGWLGWGRTAVTDMYLSSAIALSLISFFWGYRQQERPKQQKIAFILTAAFAALAFLAKGPVGVLLPGLIIFCFLFYVGQWRSVVFKETPWLIMLLVFLAIAAPWYGLATMVNGGEFLGTFFGFSNFQRFTTVLYRHAGPWYFYFPWIVILVLPWSFFLPMAMARLQFWRRKAWATSPRNQQLGLFCLFWLGIIFVFFSAAATKLAGYILPLVPGVAILITLFAGELWTKSGKSHPLRRWPFLVSFGLNSLLLVLMAIAAYISPGLVDGDPATPEFTNLLKASGLPLLFSGILGAMAVVAWAIFFKANWRKTWWLPNILAYLLTLLLVIPPLSLILDSQIQEPSRIVAQAIGEVIQPGETIFVMGYPRYSVVYYSQNSAIYVDNGDYGRELVAKDQSIGETILLVGEDRILEQFNLQEGEYKSLATAHPYHLWRVSKEKLLP